MRLILAVQRCGVTLLLCAATFAVACASHPAVPIHYAIIHDDSIVTRDTSVDENRMKSLRAEVGGDFVWFDRNGIEYVSANPATIALASKTIASLVEAIRPFSHYIVDQHGRRLVKTLDEGFIPPANADPFQPGSVFSPSPDLDERMRHQLADYTEKIVLADRQMNDLLDAALRNNDAHSVAATQKPVATYQLNGSTYEVTDPDVAREAATHARRIHDAEATLANVQFDRQRLNNWVSQQSHVASQPAVEHPDPTAQGNRPSVSFQSLSDRRESFALQNAVRDATLDLEQVLENAVRDGKATVRRP